MLSARSTRIYSVWDRAIPLAGSLTLVLAVRYFLCFFHFIVSYNFLFFSSVARKGNSYLVCLWDARLPTIPTTTLSTTTSPATTEPSSDALVICLLEKEDGRGLMVDLCFSPDGAILFVAQQNQIGSAILQWDTVNQQRFETVAKDQQHKARISALVLSPDHRYLVSGSWDKTLKIWPL